jgi:acetyltransferase-like isoleucine patch superfamily enzyme
MISRIVLALDAFAFPWRLRSATKLRSLLYRRYLLAAAGEGLAVKCGVMIDAPEMIQVGKNLSIGEYTFLVGNGGIEIGDNVLMGHHVSVISAQHGYLDSATPMISQGLTLGKIKICDDVWIGAGARVLPGVTLGTGSIVGTNSVVTRDVAAYSIVGGVPAAVIGSRHR